MKIIYDWLEPQLVRDILVFLEFANFYWRFIQKFSRIAALLISILRTTTVHLIAKDPVDVSEKSTVDRVSDNKVDRAKVGTKAAKFKSHDKSKSKNLIQALA